MKAPASPKMEALESLAKAMSQLKLDKLKGYKKTNAKDPLAEVPVDEEVESEEEEMPVLEAEAVDEEEAEEEGPQGFSKMLAEMAKKKAKKH